MSKLPLERLKIKGYKSFEEIDITLRQINIIIGANGSGKSNFIKLFTMMNKMINKELQNYIAISGGADQILYYGQKTTDKLYLEFWFKRNQSLLNAYMATLIPTAKDTLIFQEERCAFHNKKTYPKPFEQLISATPHEESELPNFAKRNKIANYVLKSILSWQLYHFHDTSDSAKVRQTGDIYDNLYLRPDASNLAAYLYLLKEKSHNSYQNIVDTVRLVAPFFGDFILRPSPFNPERIRLEWRERYSDLLFGLHALSDGTLRFICLATLFLQPQDKLPSIIILDEPELGLHPYAIAVLADMIKSVSKHTQVGIATQSVTLINQFDPEDILVIDRIKGNSTIRRLSSEEIKSWLEEYAIGDLWEKNLIGGRPTQ